jgi:hypothetical protein
MPAMDGFGLAEFRIVSDQVINEKWIKFTLQGNVNVTQLITLTAIITNLEIIRIPVVKTK